MPLNILGTIFLEGTDKIPGWKHIKTYGPLVLTAGLAKYYFGGSSNTWDRDLHGKVFIVTGGTSGIGASLVHELALRGAQLVLLTSQLGEDGSGSTWVSDYVQDLRDTTENFLIHAERCDLSSLYSVRKFATKWLDTTPPRRLDGVICLAAESAPSGKLREASIDGVEIQMAINYLGHFHLLTLLEPALKVQLADRDVRILLSSCLSQSTAELDISDLLWDERKFPSSQPWKVYGTSKLLLNMFGKEYQRRLDLFERNDGQQNNTRINIVNPGMVRTPSTRRVLSMGSIWGLILYLILYPIWWLLLKSGEQGMQSYLFALCSPVLVDMQGGNYIKECSIIEKEQRPELYDEKLQAQLFDQTRATIEMLEKNSAIARNKLKKETKEQTDTDAAISKKGKKNKNKNKSKETSSDINVNDQKLNIFTSAFSTSTGDAPGTNPLTDIPNIGDETFQITRPGLDPNDLDAKNLRLRSLDTKFERARKRKT